MAARAFPVPEVVASVWRDHLHRLFELLTTTEALVARYERDQEPLLVQTDALRRLQCSSVSLTGNTLSGDGWGEQAAGRPRPGIIMVAAYPTPSVASAAVVTGTTITGNTIPSE